MQDGADDQHGRRLVGRYIDRQFVLYKNWEVTFKDLMLPSAIEGQILSARLCISQYHYLNYLTVLNMRIHCEQACLCCRLIHFFYICLLTTIFLDYFACS